MNCTASITGSTSFLRQPKIPLSSSSYLLIPILFFFARFFLLCSHYSTLLTGSWEGGVHINKKGAGKLQMLTPEEELWYSRRGCRLNIVCVRVPFLTVQLHLCTPFVESAHKISSAPLRDSQPLLKPNWSKPIRIRLGFCRLSHLGIQLVQLVPQMAGVSYACMIFKFDSIATTTLRVTSFMRAVSIVKGDAVMIWRLVSGTSN